MNIITEPSLKDLVKYLKGVQNWEDFGYDLLPEEELELVEVHS